MVADLRRCVISLCTSLVRHLDLRALARAVQSWDETQEAVRARCHLRRRQQHSQQGSGRHERQDLARLDYLAGIKGRPKRRLCPRKRGHLPLSAGPLNRPQGGLVLSPWLGRKMAATGKNLSRTNYRACRGSHKNFPFLHVASTLGRRHSITNLAYYAVSACKAAHPSTPGTGGPAFHSGPGVGWLEWGWRCFALA